MSGNGLRIVAVREPASPLAEVRLVVPFARVERDEAAAQELLAACLGTGTLSSDGSRIRGRLDISDRAADLGADLGTVVTAESLVVSGAVLGPGLPDLLRLVSDLVVRPHYAIDELDVARARASAAPPGVNISTQLRRAALHHGYGEHPLSTGCAGMAPRPEEFWACDVTELHQLHERVIVPSGSLLLVQADDDVDRMLHQAGDALSEWSGGPSHLVFLPFARPAPAPGRVRLPPAPEAEPGSHVLMVGPALRADDPRQAALHLASTVLGGHPTALLQRHLRDELGLSYAPQVDTRETAAGCWLEISASSAEGKASHLETAVMHTLRRLADHGPDPADLERARAHARGFTLFALSTRAETATARAGFAAAGLPMDWLAHYRAALDAVTRDEVAQVAGILLDPDVMVTCTHDSRTVV